MVGLAAFSAPLAQSLAPRRQACTAGSVAGYPCHNVDLLAQLTLADLGASNATIRGNEHWRWTDPLTGATTCSSV
ncbi:MAG: hypothetical protein HZY76_03140 [Anaerolineae bacterium]|nr:MAG: hypothetical protein HZY76_03140 [Anaerolineae bacterium]